MRDLIAHLPSRRAMRRLGRAFARHARAGDVLWLEGSLGAGKTFFTRGLLRALGLPEAIPVTSPTFTLVREYDTHPPVKHLDLYRLAGPEEVLELGVDEWLEDALVVIEWGKQHRSAIGERGVELQLTVPENGSGRGIKIVALDERGREWLSSVAEEPPLG